MSRLMQDGTDEPVSLDQILRREQELREILIFTVQLTTSRIDNHTWLIYAVLKVLTIHFVCFYLTYGRCASPC